MLPHAMTSSELFYIIVPTILIGTVTTNVAVALIRNRLSRGRRIVLDAHWERNINENEDEETATEESKLRRHRCLSSASSNRGLLNNLATRASFVDAKLCESDMVTAVESLMMDIRLKFDEVAYLGRHTGKGREDEVCLYARYRLNGMTRCIGEVSSLRHGRHGAHIMVSLTSTDAALVQEKGWGVPSNKNSIDQLAAYFRATRTTELGMPLPRNMEELRTVSRPVLEAAVCSLAGVEQYA